MKLTSERANGIKTGYWSAAKKDDLVQKLGRIEHGAPALLDSVCDDCCRFPREITDQETLDALCESCPVNALDRLVDV